MSQDEWKRETGKCWCVALACPYPDGYQAGSKIRCQKHFVPKQQYIACKKTHLQNIKMKKSRIVYTILPDTFTKQETNIILP